MIRYSELYRVYCSGDEESELAMDELYTKEDAYALSTFLNLTTDKAWVVQSLEEFVLDRISEASWSAQSDDR
jgi:hypothetical protein